MATWLLFSLCPDNTNRLKVFWVKISLAVLSCGKLMDKLRYIFSQLTDSNGQLIFQRWVEETSICDIYNYISRQIKEKYFKHFSLWFELSIVPLNVLKGICTLIEGNFLIYPNNI